MSVSRRYSDELELEDAIHNAILTLKVSYYYLFIRMT